MIEDIRNIIFVSKPDIFSPVVAGVKGRDGVTVVAKSVPEFGGP